MTNDNTTGKTTLTPNVILTITRMAALQVEGVMSMAPIKQGIPKIKSKSKDGVNLILEDDIAFLDLYLVIDGDFNIRDVSRNVQQHGAPGAQQGQGGEAGVVNVHIEDIQYQNAVN